MIGDHLSYDVPKESSVKKTLAYFQTRTPTLLPYVVKGYNDSDNAALISLFGESAYAIPTMKNGHANQNKKNHSDLTIDRCLTLTNTSGELMGAVYFRINIALRRTIVANIAIHDAYRRQGLGTSLWNAACLVSILYGCHHITGCTLTNTPSSIEAKHFYAALGCVIYNVSDPFEEDISQIAMLNLKNDAEKENFIAQFKKSSPDFPIQEFLCEHSSEDGQNDSIEIYNERLLNNLSGFLQESDPNYYGSKEKLPHYSPLFQHHALKDAKKIHYSVSERQFDKLSL